MEHNATVELMIGRVNHLFFVCFPKEKKGNTRWGYAVTVDPIWVCGSVRALMNRETCLDVCKFTKCRECVCVNVQ